MFVTHIKKKIQNKFGKLESDVHSFFFFDIFAPIVYHAKEKAQKSLKFHITKFEIPSSNFVRAFKIKNSGNI